MILFLSILKMITAKLQGGLGNQMFQWAATYSAAKRYNTEYFFDLSYFRKEKSKSTRWNLEIKNFKNILVPESTEPCYFPIREDFGKFDEIKDNTFLSGYWQSEKYFLDFADEIREKFQFDRKTIKHVVKKYPNILNNSLSIHVRRGDYLRFPNIHPVTTVEYFKNAYDIIGDLTSSVFIISDDIPWCIENLKFNNATFVNENIMTDLCMISLCKNNIISNSSFSWWGAWLNSNPEKKVIAPKTWFGTKANYEEKHIVPDSWYRIN